MAVGGLALRFGGEILRFLQFATAAVILGIFSYFLATQSRQGIYIQTWERAVEGISGAATLYTLFGILLTCFLGGVGVFAVIAMILDVLFVGAFIALAIMTRGGDQNCNNISNEDTLRFGADGLGDPSAHDYVPSTYHACTLLKATFILSIIGAFLFLLSIPYQFLIAKHHRKEKRENPHVKYGMFGRRNNTAAPNTPVVAGQKRGFWRRNRRANDPEAAAVGMDNRLSGETRYGNTVATEPKYGHTNNAVNY